MNYIYILILFLPFLGGCSWWNQPSQDQSESIVILPLAPETAEVIEEITPELESSVEPQPLPQDIKPTVSQEAAPLKQSRRSKRNRRRKKVEETVQQPIQPKTMTDLAQQLPEKPTQEEKGFHAPADISTTKTDASLPELSDKSQSNQQTINVRNTIDKRMLTVKHWTGKYVPTLLKISVNGKSIDLIDHKKVVSAGEILSIPVTGDTITADYEFEFMNGRRKGSGSTVYDVEPNTKDLNMTFTWDTKWHVEFDKAKPQK